MLGPAIVLGLWWLVSASGWVSEQNLPSIPDVFSVGVDLARNGELWSALWASSRRVVIGLSLGISSGLLIAIVAGWSRLGEAMLDSTMQIIKAVPSFALTPLFIVWLGVDEAPKLLLIVLSTSVPVYMNVYGGIRNVDLRLVEAARTLGLGRRGIVRNVIAPSVVPEFLVGLRVSLANAWLALVFAEQINASSGLGMLMSDARAWLRTDIMMFVVVLYAIFGLLSYSFVRFLERRLLQWRRGFVGA